MTYSDIGGSKEQIERMREVVELPMLHPEKFVQLGIDPPKARSDPSTLLPPPPPLLIPISRTRQKGGGIAAGGLQGEELPVG